MAGTTVGEIRARLVLDMADWSRRSQQARNDMDQMKPFICESLETNGTHPKGFACGRRRSRGRHRRFRQKGG